MKKTKLIIPGLALIALSTVASIAGSVAWFTASRSATVTASSFSVVKTSANLDCTVSAGIGTYLDENNENAITLTHEVNSADVTNVLTDGSFDHLNEIIRTPNADGTALDSTNGSIALASASESNLKRGELDGGNIYTAVTFNISFKVSFGSLAGDYGLFLDNSETSGVGASRFECATTPLATAKGFRMAFVGGAVGASYTGSSTNTKVFADLQETSYVVDEGLATEQTVIACRYVGGTTAADFAPATATQYNQNDVNDLIDHSYNTALPTSETARATALARPDCLGVFAYREGSEVTLNYTVVCWFEGTDPEIINRDLLAEYQTVTSTLRFEAVQLADA